MFQVPAQASKTHGAYLGLALAIAVYWAAAAIMLGLGLGLPYGTDGNETYSSLLGGQNLLNFGTEASFLQDESTNTSPQAHPYVYTHGGNFPRFPAALVITFGADSASTHAALSVFVLGTLTVAIFFAAVLSFSSPTVALFSSIFLGTSVLLFLQWTSNSWRVWQLLFMSLTIFIASRIFASGPSVILSAISAIVVALATYTELSFGLLLVFTLVFWIVIQSRKRSLPTRAIVSLSLLPLTGVLASSLLLAGQISGYLGVHGFLQDMRLTFAARNQGTRPEDLFFLNNFIVYWQNSPDVDAFRSLSSLVLRGGLFETLSFGALPLIVLFTGMGFIFLERTRTSQHFAREEVWMSGDWALFARVVVLSATAPGLFLISQITSSSTQALNVKNISNTLILSALVWVAAAGAFAATEFRLRRKSWSRILLFIAIALVEIAALSDVFRFTGVSEPSLAAQLAVLAFSSFVFVAYDRKSNQEQMVTEALLSAVLCWLVIAVVWLVSWLLLVLLGSRGYWSYQNSIIPDLDQTSVVLLLGLILVITIGFVSQQVNQQNIINLRAQSTPLLQLTLVLAASSILVFTLSPGYVWTGYLTRFVPWVAVILPILLGVSVGAMWSAASGAGSFLKKFVIGVAVVGVSTLVWYPQASIAPRIFNSSFADLVGVLAREQPQGLVVNNYAAPFAWSAGTWGYTDWGYAPGGGGKLHSPSLERQIQGAQYVWLRDWESNPTYRNPEAAVCFSPGSIDPQWDPARGYCVTEFRKGLNPLANIRKVYQDPLGGWAVFLGDNLVVDSEALRTADG